VLAFHERQKPSRNPKYVLVHCTHGHNRTGFMIVHYLMRTQLSSVTEVRQLVLQMSFAIVLLYSLAQVFVC
jgi:mRNA-capping enzyme